MKLSYKTKLIIVYVALCFCIGVVAGAITVMPFLYRGWR